MRMNRTGLRLVMAAALIVMLGASVRQARAADDIDRYAYTNIFGLTVSDVGNPANVVANPAPAGGDYQLNLAAGASFVDVNGNFGAAGQSYDIDTVFGFYEIADLPAGTQLVVPLNGAPSGWNAQPTQNGYHTGASEADNPNADALYTPANGVASLATFSFGQAQTQQGNDPAVDYNGQLFWGYHVRFADASGQQQTGFIYGPAIPEPAFYQMAALLGLGGLGVFRRLRKGRK